MLFGGTMFPPRAIDTLGKSQGQAPSALVVDLDSTSDSPNSGALCYYP